MTDPSPTCPQSATIADKDSASQTDNRDKVRESIGHLMGRPATLDNGRLTIELDDGQRHTIEGLSHPPTPGARANCKEPPRLRGSLGSALGTGLCSGRANFRIGEPPAAISRKDPYRANLFSRPPGYRGGHGASQLRQTQHQLRINSFQETVRKEA